jgi:hypothetical protein
MSAAFTFGSFGDIIALYQIAAELARALSSVRGSAAQYRELIKDLEGFTRILITVGLHYLISSFLLSDP